MESQKQWGRVVCFFTLGMYIPLFIGGVVQPDKLNIASFGIWTFLSLVFAYLSKVLGHRGWRMAMGYFGGNIAIVGLAFYQGGYTANLEASESTALFGVVGTICAWIIYGLRTGTWPPRVLYLGFVLAEALSFYPFIKQFWGPSEFVGNWTYLAWVMGVIGPALNLLLVERLHARLRIESGKRRIVEGSLYSLENFLAALLVTILMTF